MKKILVIGSTCLDMIVDIDHIPTRCEDVNSENVEFSLGGMAYNVYNVLSLFKVPAILGCGIGKGKFADIVATMLENKGYQPIGKIKDMDNGVCICLVDKTSERSFIAQHGAEYRFDPAWYEQIDFKDIAMVYISGLEIEDVDGARIVSFLEERHLQNKIFFAPGPRIKHLPSTLLQRIYALQPIVHLNEQELKELAHQHDLEQALSLLYKQTQNIIITTLDKDGSLIYDGHDIYKENSEEQIKIIDTIGAGDGHAGACLVGLYHQLPYNKILTIANKVGANIISHRGSNAAAEDVKGMIIK